jgi:hypothetical protein
MKKYKTWEIWSQANKFVGKRFKALTDVYSEFKKGDIAEVVQYCDFIGLGAIKFSKLRITDLTGFEEWELIQQPVDFLTAVKAYSEGKTIRCERVNEITYTYKRKDGDYFKDTSGSAPCITEILEGKWYVEE